MKERTFTVLLLFAFLVASVRAQMNLVLAVEENEQSKLIKEAFDAAVKGVTGLAASTFVIKKGWNEKQVCEELIKAKPTLLIDSTEISSGSMTSQNIKAVSRKMGIPTVSTTAELSMWEKLTPDEANYLVHLPTPSRTLFDFIRALALAPPINMTTVAVIHDESFDIKQRIDKALEKVPQKVVTVKVEKVAADVAGIEAHIEMVYNNDIRYTFIMAGVEVMSKYLHEIGNVNNSLFNDGHKWILITRENTGKAVCNECLNGDFYFMRPAVESQTAYDQLLNKNLPTKHLVDGAFYYDLVRTILESVVKWPGALTYPACDGLLTDQMKAERKTLTLANYLSKSTYKPTFGKFLVFGNGKNKQEITLKIQKIKANMTTVMNETEVGTWKATGSPTGDLKDYATLIKTFTALKILRVTTLEQPPFVYKKTLPNGKVKFFGYCIDLMDEIKKGDGKAETVFEYRIFENAQRRFGDMHEVGPNKISWAGMIGDLVNNTADIALGPLAVMAERETVVDFTVPYYDLVGISILMKKPDVKSSLFKFLTVLETNVWGCILGAYFFSSVMMYLYDRLSPYSFHNNREKLKDDPENRDFNLKECLWFCMTSLTPQGGGEAPRNLSGRLVAATWWLFGFIIIASYTANLAAFLTVSRLDSNIENLDDLSRQYKIKYAPVANSAAKTYFERMSAIEERFYEIWKNMSLDEKLNETERAKLAVWDYPVSDKYTKIWWTMSDVPFPETFNEGVERVLTDPGGATAGFALIGDSTQIKYAVMTRCSLAQIGNEFSRKPLALAVQQGSELKDRLSSAILKLLNERKLETFKERWWTKNPYKVQCEDKDRSSDGISISNIGGVFIVIFIGVVLACITLAIEYCYFKQKRKKGATDSARERSMSSKEALSRSMKQAIKDK